MKDKQNFVVLNKLLRENQIELEEPDKSEDIESYVQLVKLLASEEVEDINNIVATLNKAAFTEDEEIMYSGRPAKIHYTQLPIVVGEEILVKVVLITQADSLALIVPTRVSEVYEELKEKPESIIDVNKDVNIYIEVYRFNSNDVKLHEMCKLAFVSAGDSLRAFEIPKELEEEALANDKEKPEGEDSTENFDDMFDEDNFSDDDLGLDKTDIGGGFEAVDDDFGSFEDFEENAQAYKKFKVQTKALHKLNAKLYNKVDEDVRPFIRTKLYEGSVLVIEIDNKKIFAKWKHVPKLAKTVMTNIGEKVKSNHYTQLLDSFIENDKRYFVVAEDVNNNFWIAGNDEQVTVAENVNPLIDPIQEEIIVLNRSNIRIEKRSQRPYLLGEKFVFAPSKYKKL